MQKNRSVYVLGGQRTAFVRSFTSYASVSTQELMVASLQSLVERFKLQGETLGDVSLGAVMKSSIHWNLARESVLGSGLDPRTPAFDIQRACGTSLEATHLIALKIGASHIEGGIAGGADTNSDLPLEWPRSFAEKMARLTMAKSWGEKLAALAQFRPKDFSVSMPAVVEPRTKMSMGQHCEAMVKEWRISMQEQNELAVQSHLHAAKAYESGFYRDMVMNYRGISRDSFVRGDTSMEKLAKLKPVFDRSSAGTLTAGNSTPLTDGSAVVLLGSEAYAQKKSLEPLAQYIDGEVAAVDFVKGAGLLMAPTIAVARLLERHRLTFKDFDFFEIHEAFAGQVLCTLKAWESADYCKKEIGLTEALGSIDRSKMNLAGGSVALGHPFAATGARLVATLAHQLKAKGSGRGLISVCTGGGMGVAAILERP